MIKSPLCITYNNCCEENPDLNGCILGEGNFGIVSKINCDTDIKLKDKCNLAAKKNIKMSDYQTIKHVKEEIEMLELLKDKSPYIINLYATEIISKEEVNLYLQLINGYDLKEYYRLGLMEKLNIKMFITGLVNGLKIIHENNILHSDIKPANILINTNVEPYPIPVYVDFGLAIIVTNAAINGFPGLRKGGSPGFFLEGEEVYCSVRSDIFALATTLRQVCKKKDLIKLKINGYLNNILSGYDIRKNFQEICSLFPNSNEISYKKSELDTKIPMYYSKHKIYSALANIPGKIYSASKIPIKLASSVLSKLPYRAKTPKVTPDVGGKKNLTLKRRKTTKRRRPIKKRKRPTKRRRAGKSSRAR